MFDQELFDQPAEPLKRGDLFYDYERKPWNFSSRLYKILGVSALINFVVIMVVAQTNLLTMKGCDSPLVGGVCRVLDVVYVGAMLTGTDREYVDAEYEKTTFEDSEITMIDLTGETGPIDYPEGYFQIANPVQWQEQQAMLNGTDMVPFSPSPAFNPPPMPTMPNSPSLLDKPQKLPPRVKNRPKDDDVPLFTTDDGEETANANGKKGKTDESADRDKTGQDVKPSDPEKQVPINKKPMQDFANGIVDQWTKKEIDLSKPFAVELNGTLLKSGQLDPKKTKWNNDPTVQNGDPKMIEAAKQAVEAMNQAGWLQYLTNLGVDKIKFTLIQDESGFRAVISSTLPTTEKASTVSSGMNGAIIAGKVLAKEGSDERVLLEFAKTKAEGKNFLLNFELPKDKAHEMINRNLQKVADAKKNGTNGTDGTQNTTGQNRSANTAVK